jgi:flagellar M-ring protein FliF
MINDSHCLELPVATIKGILRFSVLVLTKDCAHHMDVLPRITRQMTDLFQKMSPNQRVISAVVVCCLLCGFGWMVIQQQNHEFLAVSSGKIFTAEEMSAAERTLTTAGLTGFRREGRRLLAPAKDLDRYNAALLESESLSADLGSQMLRQYEKLGPFSTERQRQQMKEASLLQELRRRIKEVPDIEDAHIAIASSERKSGWNQKSRTTANVSLKPRAGRELSSTLINSLRHVVANTVADLKPADVTIFDVTRGQAYIGETNDDPTDSQYLQRAREFTRQYEQQIHKALSHIRAVNVTVHVDLDTLKSSMIRSETVRSKNHDHQVANQPLGENDSDSHLTGFRGSSAVPTETIREVSEKQLVAAIPRAVQVCVTIPRDYARDVAMHRLAKGEKSESRLDPQLIEEEELTKVERIIGRLIPADSSPDAISVTFVDRVIDETGEDVATSPLEQLTQSVQRSPGILAVGGVGLLLAFLIWHSAASASVKTNDPEPLSPSIQVSAPTESVATDPISGPQQVPDRIALLRDEVRAMAGTDPAAAASLLGRWLTEAAT